MISVLRIIKHTRKLALFRTRLLFPVSVHQHILSYRRTWIESLLSVPSAPVSRLPTIGWIDEEQALEVPVAVPTSMSVLMEAPREKNPNFELSRTKVSKLSSL